MSKREERINRIELYWKGTEQPEIFEGTVHFTKDNSNVICITKTDYTKVFVPITNLSNWTFQSKIKKEESEDE